ncbi:MAG: radical SAM protein [Chloroflexi bacterium]|nr:radical SAM protein [Chloroflexota bacterium]
MTMTSTTTQQGFDLQRFASELVESTRAYIYIRPQDGLIILRPNRIHHLNPMATLMLDRLYAPDAPSIEQLVSEISETYHAEPERVRTDLKELLYSVAALLNDDVCGAPKVRQTTFGSHKRELPVLSEIALTYRCQNRCTFCYADAPKRGRKVPEMDTAEVMLVIDRLYDEAHCPTVSFTGGEPTLREDLPELVAYAKAKGMRVNLITNGLACADPAYVARLKEAGLDSAQVSLEGATAEVHDAITQHLGAFVKTVAAVHNLRAVGIHTHTNTTVCGGNRDHLLELVDFIAQELKSEYFSMNMVIRTGTALDHAQDDIRYSSIGEHILAVQARAKERGVRLVWYSPVPYCLFNPVQAGLGAKSCACVDGLISVNPAGELLPCSSFEDGIGDLLHDGFEAVWHSRTALYWRRKEFIPPDCQRCQIRDICCGACPLYWDERGSFEELAAVAPGGSRLHALGWRVRKRLHAGTRGVGL